jgi:hypothetical protein
MAVVGCVAHSWDNRFAGAWRSWRLPWGKPSRASIAVPYYSTFHLSAVQLDPPKPPLKRGALKMFPPFLRGGKGGINICTSLSCNLL